jgi:hypothetical protein
MKTAHELTAVDANELLMVEGGDTPIPTPAQQQMIKDFAALCTAGLAAGLNQSTSVYHPQ